MIHGNYSFPSSVAFIATVYDGNCKDFSYVEFTSMNISGN